MTKISFLLSSLALASVSFFWGGCGAAVLSDEGLAKQAGSQFEQMKRSQKVSGNSAHKAMIQRIGKRITDVAEVDVPGTNWEFVVFDKSEPNAFAMINQNWRYIHYADGTEELYNLQKDPHEWENIASNPEFSSIKERLKSKAPKNQVQPGLDKAAGQLKLVLDGDSFHWEVNTKKRRKK